MDRILIPEDPELKEVIYQWSHAHPSAGHFGQNATCEEAKIHFYFPGLNHYLKKRVKECEKCLQKQQKVNVKDMVHKPHKLGYPGKVLFIDLVGPLPESPTGMRYVMTL